MIVELERIESWLVGKHPALVAVSAGLRKLVPNVAGVFWIAYLAVLALAFLFVFGANEARAERIKDLVTIQGIRGNQLIGYGLIVVGLDGSGDQTTQTPFTVQSITSMLGQLGVNLPPGHQPAIAQCGNFGHGIAAALDGRVIQVQAPAGSDQRVAFLARSRVSR